ncbi:MAG: PDZ domain-containing protein [Cyanobacteria bacterium Co-bin8]|nr:PDZ domain-containing protein [Cyanobacteria bacterium Co-bin8]
MPSSRKALLLTSSLAFVSIAALAPIARAALQDSPKATLDQAWQIINREYVDPDFNQVDWEQVRQTLLSPNYSSQEEAYAALREALQQLNDPYTRFMSPTEFQAFQNQTRGELVGVGMRLALDGDTETLMVVQPIENSPALEAGVQAGDLILQIDGTPTQGMTVEAAADLIRGEAGTPVQMLLQRNDTAPFVMTLTRAKIDVPVVHSAVRREGGHSVGYIRLSQFNAHSAEQMQRAITSLQNQQVDGFVLDLRNNPGGRLDQAIAIARMWISEGDIVRTVDRNGSARQIAADGTALTELPLTVLVNGNSASASEILAGALQDDHRATVVGTQTFGKALVQSVNPLGDGSGLNVTIARYFTPSGSDINHRGIAPDVVVDASEDEQKELWSHPERLGTGEDVQYSQAIEQLQSQWGNQNQPSTAQVSR